MKINYISRLAILLLIVTGACTVQENPSSDPTSSQAISVVADAQEPGTKTTLSSLATQWVANTDKIGIFSPQAKATADGTPEANPAKNLAFTAQTAAKSSKFTGSMYRGCESDHTFYAYYPYNSGYTGDQTAVPISLPSAQTQSEAWNTEHIGALDFMVANPLTVAYNRAVNLTFLHVFSMIEFQIIGSGTLSEVRLSGANPLAFSGTINLAQTPGTNAYSITQNSTTNYVSVSLGIPQVLRSFSAVSVYMMVLPGTQSENIEIALKIDGNWNIISKTPPTGGFARGKKYVVSLNSDSEEWIGTFTDSRDGNTYHYKTIGTQVWMTENLKYLPSVVGPGTSSTSTAYYYVYGYDSTDIATAKSTSNYSTYGVLYNWSAAMTACPSGWCLPSDTEWTFLTENLGGESVAGEKMKETGTSHWNSPNAGATNESGFSGLPGGFRHDSGTFASIGDVGLWWSTTKYQYSYVWRRFLHYNSSRIYRENNGMDFGLSIRCLKI